MLGIALGPDCPVLNTPLKQLSELFSTLRAIVVGVRREGTLFVPAPGDQLFDGDQIYVFTHSRTSIARWRSSARRPRCPSASS
jgi:trk system potassium uptake protein TrkA